MILPAADATIGDTFVQCAEAFGANAFLAVPANAARNYPPAKLKEIHHLLREADMRSKGMGSTSADDAELLRELVARIAV